MFYPAIHKDRAINKGNKMAYKCPLCGDEVPENEFSDIKVDMEFENWTCIACGMIFGKKKKSLKRSKTTRHGSRFPASVPHIHERTAIGRVYAGSSLRNTIKRNGDMQQFKIDGNRLWRLS